MQGDCGVWAWSCSAHLKFIEVLAKVDRDLIPSSNIEENLSLEKTFQKFVKRVIIFLLKFQTLRRKIITSKFYRYSQIVKGQSWRNLTLFHPHIFWIFFSKLASKHSCGVDKVSMHVLKCWRSGWLSNQHSKIFIKFWNFSTQLRKSNQLLKNQNF